MSMLVGEGWCVQFGMNGSVSACGVTELVCVCVCNPWNHRDPFGFFSWGITGILSDCSRFQRFCAFAVFSRGMIRTNLEVYHVVAVERNDTHKSCSVLRCCSSKE